jgi:RNA polymerase sigma-70 factor, ECF subfamily
VNRTPLGAVLFKEVNVNAWVGTTAEGVVTFENSRESEFQERLAASSRLAFRVALAVLHNAADAEDIAQEALVKAYHHFHRLRDPDRFRAWLVRVTWRLAADRIRATVRREKYEQQLCPPHAEAASVEEAVASREIQQHIERAVDALPEKLRMTLILAAVEGYDTAEVARLLGVPEGTVKSRLHLARKKLAERLQWLVTGTRNG